MATYRNIPDGGVEVLTSIGWEKIPPEVLADIFEMQDALVFYASPMNYHAIAFIGDRPCGDFADDFSEDHGDENYNRSMPGATARKALKTIMIEK